MPFLPPLTALPLALLLSLTDPFTFEFASQTDANGMAYVVLRAQENARGVNVTIEGDDGTRVSKSVSLAAGSSKKITWRQQGDETHYKLSIKGDDLETDFEFDTRKARAGGKPGLTMVASREDIVDRHTIKYKTGFVISSYLFQVFNTEGDIVQEINKEDVNIGVGEVVEQTWEGADDVFMVYFKGMDDVGRFAEDRRVPWAVTIPHTEVNFDSGKWDIKPGEAPKVDEAFSVLVHELDGLERANSALGPNFKDKISASLYIVGYTDTVGNAADNQVLSLNRAKAIAQYFKDKGAWCSIYYAGMGERGLAVETGDSVDEVRNRRALYLLMPDPQKPAAGGKVPGSWKQLTGASPRTMAQLPALPDSYLAFKDKQRAERERKFGKSSASEGGTSGGDGDEGGDGWVHPYDRMEHDEDDAGYGAPEPIEGDEAGSATGKGCSAAAASDRELLGAALLVGLVGLARRRRR
ncbi:MAG: OmpA family protein [Myxococcales bacterium]|nr:OmpA family protein [Myxococcales bacterium]